MSAALYPQPVYPQPVADDLYDQIAAVRWPAIGARRSVPAITAVPPLPEVEYVTTRGPWDFTRQTTMDRWLIDEFYDLYSLAFEPLKKRSVARQVLTESEFTDQMLDERVVKYVARSHQGQPLGLTTLTNELDSVPWVSPDYFTEHYPDHSARNAVYYLGFTLAHPSQRHLRFIETIIMVGLQNLALEHAVVAYDVCAFNNLELKFNERVAGALRNFPTATFELVDTQYYSCVTFS
jgi:hypothetical protein